MKQYLVKEVSEKMQIQKDTLRYYEKVGLSHPSRGNNGYRTYSEENILELTYIQVMKEAGFSLAEIKSVMYYFKKFGEACDQEVEQQLVAKKQQVHEKIRCLHIIETLLDTSIETVRAGKLDDYRQMDELVLKIYEQLQKGELF